MAIEVRDDGTPLAFFFWTRMRRDDGDCVLNGGTSSSAADSNLQRMKRIPALKVFAFTGWVLWPAVLLLPYVASRLASRMSMETWAEYAGNLQARAWFQEGKYRMLELSPEEKSHYTGRMDNDFEIWTWKDYANSSWLVAGSADRHFVESFNQRMRRLSDERRNEKR